MSLSVCIIARNESGNIARAINSVRSIADEIVLIDTGSTDDTEKIAADLGARVSRFSWCDDFSAARNFSFEQASGDWILWLDADEEVMPVGRKELRDALRRKDAFGYYVIRRDLADDCGRYSEMWQLRLFKNRPCLKLAGRIHEHFEPPLHETAAREGKRLYYSNFILRHYGYMGNLLRPKLERAALLLYLELAENPGQLYYMIEYGRTLAQLGDPKSDEVMSEAARMVAAVKADPEPPLNLAALLLEHLLVSTQEVLPREDVLDMARRWFPKSPPLIWYNALACFEKEDFEGAAGFLEKLVRIGKTGDYDRSVSFSPHIIGDEALLNLGVCYIRMAELDRAESCFKKLLGSPSCGEQARRNLEAIRSICTDLYK